MSRITPSTDEEFDALMRDVDQELIASGRSIPQRPILAVIAVGQRLGISIPLIKALHEFEPTITKNGTITERVYRWYNDRYGDRLKMDFSPGRMVLLVEGDPWVLRFPLTYGSVSFVALRITGTTKQRFTSGSSLCNVVELLEDIPPSRVRKLSDTALDHILDRFFLGHTAFNILKSSADHELVRIASGNINAAVTHMMATTPQYGVSKWESLQAAEKILKAAIDLAGASYPHTHNLNKLAMLANENGIQGNWQMLIADIQCTPRIRYGEESCDLNEAITAQHASLVLINSLYECGAGFKFEGSWSAATP